MIDTKKILKLVRNIVRVGVINSINPQEGTVKVLFPDKDDIVSDNLPLLNHEYNMPNIGDQVICLFLGNGLEQGFCLGSFYSSVLKPPATNENIYKKKLDNATFVEYDKESKVLKVNVEEVEIKINKGKVTVKADEILLGDNATEGIPLGNQLKNWLDNHTHSYSWNDGSGSSTTSAPSYSSPTPSEVVKVK